MPDLAQIQKDMGEAFTGFKTMIERQSDEIKGFGTALQETKNVADKLADQVIDLAEQVKGVQTKLNRPGLGGTAAPSDDPESKAFFDWMRKGDKIGPEQAKALATDSDVDGGYLLAPNARGQLIEQLTKVSPVRQFATVETINQGNAWEAPKETGDIEGGWVAERQSRPQTGTPKVGLEIIPAHELYAAPRITQRMLDDSGFNVESWLSRKLAAKFAKDEGRAFLLGSGSGQPQGILVHPDVTAIPSGAASTFDADSVLDLYFALDEEYAVNGTWMLKRSTLREIMKLKDSHGDFLFKFGVDSKVVPPSILDRPYALCDDMPAVAANSTPLVFGDIAQGYVVVDRQGIVVQRDPYTAKPFVEFYTTRRVGGGVVKADALKKLKIAAS